MTWVQTAPTRRQNAANGWIANQSRSEGGKLAMTRIARTYHAESQKFITFYLTGAV